MLQSTFFLLVASAAAWQPAWQPRLHTSSAAASSIVATAATAEVPMTAIDVNTALKLKILQLAAALDRGQSYNPSSSDAYAERMELMEGLIGELVAATPPLPASLEALDGEWELCFTSVKHGIFRSSPFFLAIQAAYARAGEPEKAELFFRLHELQTCSWGVSKIGRVAQVIDPRSRPACTHACVHAGVTHASRHVGHASRRAGDRLVQGYALLRV